MSSDVRYIYTNNISNINQIEQGSFVYNINDQRLYLCTPEGAGESKLLAAVGRSIIYINSLEDIETYQNNEIYLTQDGKLYYYHRDVNTNPQEIASVKVLEDLQKEYKAADETLQRQIGYYTYTDSEGTTVPAIGLSKDIEDINKIIGEAGGTAGREATGLYKIIFDLDAAQKSSIQNLDNKKVDTKTFEETLKNYSTTEDLNTDLENNYYTKTQAKDLFLSANEELFLTEGAFIANCEYAEVNDRYILWNDDLTDVEKLVGPCIVLTIKNNSTATDQEELQINTIVIPAIDLVDVYKGSSATDSANVDVDVANYTVSANINVDNLIGSTDNDTVKLSNNGTNKIIASFKTENIVDSTTAGKNVSLSVGDDNKISAQIEIDNLIKNTSGSLVTLEKNQDGKTMSVLLDSSVSNAIKQVGNIIDIEHSVETLTETLSQYGIANLAENETEYQLKEDGLIAQAIKVEADKIAELNENFTNHETEFNTHKQAFENYKTTNNTNITNIGSYQYNAKTDDKEAEVIVSKDTYFAEVKEHIDAETASIRESLNNTKTNLDKEINDLKVKDSNIDTSISTLESWVGSIYQVKDEDGNNLEKPTGKLPEMINSESAERIAADTAIGFYKHVSEKMAEDGTIIPAHYEADGYFDIVKQHIEEEEANRISADNALNALITEINDTTIPTINQTIQNLAGGNNESTVVGNASAITELQNKINNSDTGLAKAHSKIDDLAAAAGRAYVETPTTENDSTTYALTGGYIKDYVDNEIDNLENTVSDTYQTLTNATSRFNKTETTDASTGEKEVSYTGEIVTAYTSADTILETKLTKAITDLSTGAVQTNTNNIKNLKDNFDEAIGLAKATDSEKYSLTGGAVKEYVDALAGANNTSTVAANAQAIVNLAGTNVGTNTVASNAQAISDLDTAYKNADKALTITTIECGLYKLNDSNKPDATNGIDKHSLKITFENNATAYYPLGNYIKDNYYTKTEADSAFLGADKDLFLTNGNVLKGTYDTSTKEFTEDNENGTWHIILTLRDVNADDDNPGEQIVIPADSLVTYYTANNTNKPVTITINGFEISADLTTEVKNQLGQVELTKIDNATPPWDSNLSGTTLADKVNSLPTYVSTNYATKTSIDGLFKANTVGTTTTYTGSIGELINGINSNIDNIETALSDEGDTGKAIKANTQDIADIGEYAFDDQSKTYTATANTSFGNVNKHITEVIGSVNDLSDSIGLYDYTKSSSSETLGTAEGSTKRFINVQNHINDLEAYVDQQDEALGDRIGTDEKALKDYKDEVGTISLTDATYSLSESGYIKLLNDKLSGEINSLKDNAVASNTSAIDTINRTLNNYLLDEENGVIPTALSLKMDKANPTGTGSFRLNKGPDTITLDNGEEYEVTIGEKSTALGDESIAEGYASHAEGFSWAGENAQTRALLWLEGPDPGSYTHAEGLNTAASGTAAHAEGSNTIASSVYTHAEGLSTAAAGTAAHAEGGITIATGNYSHAEGYYTTAFGTASHTEGNGTTLKVTITGDANATVYTLATTSSNIKIGQVIQYEDIYAKITAYDSTLKTITVKTTLSTTALTSAKAVIYTLVASGNYSHAEGENTIASNDSSHAEGYSTTASGVNSHAEGENTTASGSNSHAEGYRAKASGNYSHAEGYQAKASGSTSHAEGSSTEASGNYSHAEGYAAIAYGSTSHVEGFGGTMAVTITGDANATTYTLAAAKSGIKIGQVIEYKNIQAKITAYDSSVPSITVNTTLSTTALTSVAATIYTLVASGSYSHAEGNTTIASGSSSHAEGSKTRASGNFSHAEGESTIASGTSSHAEGYNTSASGGFSHATGYKTKANGDYSWANGYNTIATGDYQTVIGKYNVSDTTSLFIIGNGTSTAARSNAMTVDTNGYLTANKVYGSVWNDYAEYRQTHNKVRPGQCVYEKGDGSLAISYERMMPGANIVSDTFGFAIGETDDCKTPLAVSGRVLAYPYEPKEEYKAGDAVCSGPNGTISKMTRAEIRDYPERIVGTISEIPTYEVWGSGNVKVNGRIWIKVR